MDGARLGLGPHSSLVCVRRGRDRAGRGPASRAMATFGPIIRVQAWKRGRLLTYVSLSKHLNYDFTEIDLNDLFWPSRSSVSGSINVRSTDSQCVIQSPNIHHIIPSARSTRAQAIE